ncbi:MAG: glycosyltransferase [Chitinophagaceae bacterium]|nr:glycosyltransferase [Chitinophagaceae bacterium]
MNPLVTIAVFSFNAAERIEATLDSVKSQTYSNVELIILDDGSRDKTVAIVKGWIESNQSDCRFISHSENMGICASVNEVLRISNGEYITFIGDDIMFQSKISNDVAYMQDHPEMGFCHSDLIANYMKTGEKKRLNGSNSTNAFHDFFAWKMVIYSPTIFYRRKVFNEVGYYDESLIFEDFDMLLRIAYKFKVGYRSEVTVLYNITGSSISFERADELVAQSLTITRKWKFLKNYNYYLSRRHLALFYNLAEGQKRKALKYILRSARFITDKRLYSSLYRLFFKW